MNVKDDRNRIYFLLAVIVFMSVLSGCGDKKPEFKYKYVRLTDFFPYMATVKETRHIKFINKDVERQKYRLEGFRTVNYLLPRTWAVGDASIITAYFTELSDREAVLRCRPYTPQGKPVLTARVYINRRYLKDISFDTKRDYRFHIPGNFLVYGSNRIEFRWKTPLLQVDPENQNYAIGFSYLKFVTKGQEHGAGKNETVKPSLKTLHGNNTTAIEGKSGKSNEVKLVSQEGTPRIDIPVGGVVEYFLNVPESACLKFSTASRMQAVKRMVLHVAAYNEAGKIVTADFRGRHLNNGKANALDLSVLGEGTIKLVFANSLKNPLGFTLSLEDPSVFTVREQRPPAFAILDKETKDSNVKTVMKRTADRQRNGKRKPNVFIYLVDTLRADHMGCYGYSRPTTPNIDAFSKEGILFTRCFSVASWTKPTVASILTGLYPGNHGAENRDDTLSLEVETIAEVLKRHGYNTIHITPNVNASREIHSDQGADYYRFSIGGKHGGDFYRTSEFLNMEFADIIENTAGIMDKPIFAYLHTVDPHDPYTPKEPFLKFKQDDPVRDEEKLGLAESLRIKRQRNKGLDEADLTYIKSLYDCEILHNDYYFNEFVNYLKKKGLYDNSVIIFIADHGEQFSEHGELFHGHSIYNEEVHIPLIIKFPGGEFAGKQTDLVVSQVDIFPTIIDYLGIGRNSRVGGADSQSNVMGSVDGESILDLLERPGFGRHVFIKEKLSSRRRQSYFVGAVDVVNFKKHIVSYRDEMFLDAANFELYDLVNDFNEVNNNLEGKGDYTWRSVKFLSDCFLVRMRFGLKAGSLDYRKMDPEKIEQLKALGYL